MGFLGVFGLELSSQSWPVLVMLGLYSTYLLTLVHSRIHEVKPPLIGRRYLYEPRWVFGFRFMRNSSLIIQSGYEKFKNTAFRIRRNDGDIYVIPGNNLERLRNLPEEVIHGMEAHVKSLFGPYTMTDMMLESDLPTRVIQQKLTPNLARTVPMIREELKYALDIEIPFCEDEWVPVRVSELLDRIIARVSARVFLGPVICRSEEWLEIGRDFTDNVQRLIMTFRMIPSYMHFLVAPFIPAYWRIRTSLKAAKRFMRPIIRERRATREFAKNDDLLQWMMDLGSPHEVVPDKLAHRQLLMRLAATHTSGMAAAHVLYDLCAYPKYLGEIREELVSVTEDSDGWHKNIIPKLKKLDSFMKESQRLNPPALIAFNRIARVPVKLSDATTLPPGIHFCMASNSISHDAALLPGGGDPGVFDPFRWLRLRDDPSDPENTHRYQFATTDSTSIHFGHGKFACPGRFFAGQMIKMIIGHILLLYDIEFPEGQGRPQNFVFDENIYPDPKATVFMRRRK